MKPKKVEEDKSYFSYKQPAKEEYIVMLRWALSYVSEMLNAVSFAQDDQTIVQEKARLELARDFLDRLENGSEPV